ncbi:general secretion pathway protein GspB [Amphritea sp. HPY]|uniref:general secretion pathway protein GspB n=1 Tax=Amphritea sp. HPY TaxID=3421652 RepID=UPI003D7F04A6
MSYILDALKQSDKQRQMSSELDSVVPSMAATDEVLPERKRYWLAAGVLVLLLIAGGIYNSFQSSVAALGTSVLPPAIIVEDVGLPSAPDAVDKQALYGVSIKVAEPESVAAQTARQKAPLPVRKVEASIDLTAAEPATVTKVPATEATTEIVAMAKPVTAPEKIQPAAEEEVIYWRQLPAGVQRELPQLSFSVHIYARQPASRMVKVNGRMLREGDQISPQVRLDEITRSGVILIYKGYRFRMNSV